MDQEKPQTESAHSLPHPLREFVFVGIIIALFAIMLVGSIQLGYIQISKQEQGKHPIYKKAMATYFWVGEKSGRDNNYIANTESYFDEKWQEHYGGVDDPQKRCGSKPCDFTPRENPFYFALPYGERGDNDNWKPDAKLVPWYSQEIKNLGKSLLKNRWIEVFYVNKTCYAQWEDVGPLFEDDFAYVFGTSTLPKNKENNHAGLDLSPAMWDCLGLKENDYTEWRFVEMKDVPAGPWRGIITK